MKQAITIYSATRGNVDGTNYSSVWAESEEEQTGADTIGKPPMKINCAPQIIDALRGKIPGSVIADMAMISGGGAKGGLYIRSVEFDTKSFISPSKI